MSRAARGKRDGAVAIVGMSCRFGGANDVHAYWDMALARRAAFEEVPERLWNHDAIYSENPRHADKAYSRHGAFLDDITSFPALTLQIPPRRVDVTDPQQRVLLECALQAMQDSGRAPKDLPRDTGVYVGVTATEFRSLATMRTLAQTMATGAWGSIDGDASVIAKAVERVAPTRPFSAIGTLGNMNAALVAQQFRFTGPAYSVDAACASSLVAVTEAVEALRSHRVEVALAGGVYVCLSPTHYVGFNRLGAMSKQGACLPFDERADGFVQGDGVGVVMLKRLEDALADGDRIYATIEGAALNNDGGSEGPMAPVKSGQVQVIERAWANAGVDPALLGYVEAHGTGTNVGDQIEFDGLNEALGDQVQRAALGSTKANVGHTMSAAGVAGLIRAALAVHHRTIPPMAGFETPKPGLGLEGSPFRVPVQPEPWDAEQRAACVSSFGFGGTNAHAVLREAPAGSVDPTHAVLHASASPSVEHAAQAELVLLSARDDDALRTYAARIADAVEADPRVSVAGVARALAPRTRLARRAALVADSREQLLERLRALASGTHPEGAAIGDAAEAPKLAFLYPGQGAQRVGMIAGIAERFAVARDALDAADEAAKGITALPITHYLYPERRESRVDAERAASELTDTQHCQPALLAVGSALTSVLSACGVTPDVVAGHSVGEFSAAVAGGVLSAAEGVRWTALRGKAMSALDGDTGAMVAIVAARAEVEEILVDGAQIANVNHPRQMVVSGTTEAVEQVALASETRGWKTVRLTVSHGFHSDVFAELDLDEVVGELSLSDPALPVASCIDAAPYADAAAARSVFRRHATSPVLFDGTVRQCRELGVTIYLQMSAGGPLRSFVRGSLGDDPAVVLSIASKHDDDGGRSLLLGLGELFVRGVDVDPRALCAAAPVASLPPELLPRERYWLIGDRPKALKLAGVEATSARAPEPAARTVAAPAQEAIPEAAPAAASASIGEIVLGAVARASAYPLDALRVTMTLTDDLGFDSMMMADLAEELRKAIPGLPGIPQELLINTPTIADLTAFCENPEAAGAAEQDDDAPLFRYAPAWRASAAATARPEWQGRKVLVVGRDRAAAAPVHEALAAEGAVATLWLGGAPAPTGAVDTVVYVCGGPSLPPLNAVLAGEAPRPDLARELIDALDAQARAGARPQVAALHRDDVVWAQSLVGVVKSVSREWPDARAKAIELDGPLDAPRVLSVLATELFGDERSVHVRYADGARFVEGAQRVQRVVEPWTPAQGDRALITGGTRGIGLELAKRLVARGASVVLVGRRAPEADVAEWIAGQGDRAKSVAADVCDGAAFAAACAPHGPYTAFVHSAGVLADGALGGVDPEAGALARSVKVDGWINGLRVCGASLKRSLVIGSWAGRFGSRHQAHYAAANAMAAALAAEQQLASPSACSEFGPWTDSEMAATIPEAVRAAMRAEGVDFVGREAGMNALLEDLGAGGGIVIRGRRVPATSRNASVRQRFDADAHRFLRDHAIDGHPVLPLASATDLVAHAAALPAPYAIRDLTLYQGVVVDEPVALEVRAEGQDVSVRAGEVLHYRATVEPCDVPSELPPALQGGSAPEGLTLRAFYDEVTFHGPLLQGIESIDGIGEDFVRGTLRVGSPGAWLPETQRSHWDVDPLVLDSAMQLSAYVAWTRFGRAGTPVGIDELIVLGPLADERVLADVRFGASEDDRFSADIVIRTLSGEARLVARGVTAQLRRAESKDEASTLPADFQVKPEWVNPAEFPGYKDLQLRKAMVEGLGLQNPYFDMHEGTARNTSMVEGREVINFSSYNYLGLSGDPRIIEDVHQAMHQYGTSVSASRIASGERPFHRELELGLARAIGVEDAVVMPSGHATNVTTIGHLMGPKDLCLHDELIHDSCLQGIKLSGAARRSFRHEDVEHAAEQLRELRPHYEKVLILKEGVYSMDGDVSDIPAFIELKKTYGCMLMVDEAHSFGTIGSKGFGIADHFDIDALDVDVWMGTMSKSLASMGGWIAGRKELVEFLKYTTPGFVFAAGMTPTLGQSALSALRLMHEEPWRVHKLQHNARFFYEALNARGIDTGVAKGMSPVIPAITGDSMHALLLAQALLDDGVNAKPIIFPAVGNDAARLRFFLSSLHTEEELTRTADLIASHLARIRAEHGTPGA